MKFFQWLKPQFQRRSPDSRANAGLRLMRLEKRRLLNGDFSFAAGLDLTLENIDADLTVRETAADFQFILNTGQWTGTDVGGAASGAGTNTLSVDKLAFGNLTGGTTIQSGTATTLNLESALPTLDLSAAAGELVISDFDSVNQAIATAVFNDLTIRDADTVNLNQVDANDITLIANEIEFSGGVNSIVGSTLNIATSSISTIVVGGTTDVANELSFTDTEIAALSNGFQSISIGAPGAAGVTVVVDSSGASFGDSVTLNAQGVGGSLRVDGQLDTLADGDLANITLNGDGSGTRLSADLITGGGRITLNDGLLVDGTRMLDSTGGEQFAGGDIQVSGVVDGLNAGSTDDLLIDAGTTGDVQLQSDVGSSNPLGSLSIQAASSSLQDVIVSGSLTDNSSTTHLLSTQYVSLNSNILINGNVNLLASGLSTVVLQSGGDMAITVNGRITGVDNSLQIDSQGDVSLGAVNVANGDVTIRVDIDDDGEHNGTFGAILGDQVSISGSAAGNDLVQFNGPVTSRDEFRLLSVDSLTLNSSIATTGGDVTIEVANDFTIGSSGSIASNGGNIALLADSNTDGDGGFAMNANATVDAGAGSIDITATEDVVLSDVTTTNGGAAAVSIASAARVTGVGPNPHIAANSVGAVTTIRAGSDIGVAGPDLFSDDGFQPLITQSSQLDLVAGGDIVVRDVSSATMFSQLGANPGIPATLRIEASGDIDLTNTVGLEAIDQIALISDATVTVPADISADRLLLVGRDIVSPGTITANDLVFRSQQSESITIDAARFDGLVNGDFNITSAGGPNQLEIVDLNGDGQALEVTAGNLNLLTNGPVLVSDRIENVDGNVALNVNAIAGASADFIIDATIQAMNGSIEIGAQNDIRLLADAVVESSGGSISLTANQAAGQQGGSITMADGSRIQSQSGEISLAADGDITLGLVQTQNATPTAVSIVTTSGGVIDGGDSQLDIVANQPGAVTTIESATGVGANDAIETHVATLDVVNAISGGIVVTETDAIDLSRVLQQQDDAIKITADGEVTVLANGSGIRIADGTGSSGPATIELTSSNSNVVIEQTVANNSDNVVADILLTADGANSDVEIRAAVDTRSGDLSVRASDGIQLSADGDLTSGGAGNISLTSNTNGSVDDSSGEIFMEDGAFVDAVTGTISLMALAGDVGNITLGGLFTANATIDAVTIRTTGSVIDGGDTHTDIEAQEPGARTTIVADNGIGAGNTLETNVDQLDISNSASDNIEIFEDGDLEIFGIDQTGNVDIRITAGGTLTIHESGTGITIRDVDPGNAGQRIELNALNGDVIVDQAITIIGGDENTAIVFNADGTDSDVIVNAAVTNEFGRIEITADDSVEFTADGDVFSGASGVTIVANSNDAAADSGNQILMQDGALIDAGTGTIDIRAVGANGGSITVGGLLTQNATSVAVLLQTSQSVLDGGDTHIDIDVNESDATTTVHTETGFGADDSIETRIDRFDIQNSSVGAIAISEADALRIERIDQQAADDIRVFANGDIEVASDGSGVVLRDVVDARTPAEISIGTEQGSIRVDQSVTNLSNNTESSITLDANGTDSDIEINALVNTVAGDIQFVADDEIHLTLNGDTTAAGDGNVTLIANDDDTSGDSLDGIRMEDGAVINADTGTISLSAIGANGGDITLGSLVTNNSTSDAVAISASGGVIDGGDGDLDIVANQPSARTTIRTSAGIGSGNAIDVQIHEIVAVNDDDSSPATGNIEIQELDDLDIIAVDNNANAAQTGDTANGVVSIAAGGDVRIIDDNDANNAALQSENAIELLGQNISIDDDVVAVDETPGVDGNIDERIEIAARGNFELLDQRSISTDDDPTLRTVTPNVFTDDTVRVVADSDGNAPDVDGDGVPDEGIVFFAETSSIRTDGGAANLFADRPEVEVEDTAFYDATTIAVSELEFVEVSAGVGNVYQALLTVQIGNAGEENLIFDVDWGDGRTNVGFANELDPDSNGRFNSTIDSDKNQFLIPRGGETYVIPHRYTDFDILTNVPNQAGRTEASDALPVRFSVSQHSPSIEVQGRAIVNPGDTVQASPIVVPTSDDISPLARLSSTDVVDLPTDELPRFDNGVTAFTVVTRSVPAALLKKEVVEVPSVKPIDASPDPVFADDAVVSSETQNSTAQGGVGSEDFFQLRRRFADGTTDVIIERISEGEGDELFDTDTFEKFVADENLDDGSGYEIWLITSDPGGNVPVERPVFEFDITAGRPGPASEDLSETFDEMRLVPVDEPLNDAGNDDAGENRESDQPMDDPDESPAAEPMNELNDSAALQKSNDSQDKNAAPFVAAAASLTSPISLLTSRFSKRARALRRIQQAAADGESTLPMGTHDG